MVRHNIGHVKNMTPLEVYIFYSPTCPRCKPIHKCVDRAKAQLKEDELDVRFYYMNIDKPTVQTVARRKYPCLSRIPTVTALNDIYWVGIPDYDDFIGVLRYLAVHEEGGKGAYHNE